MLGYPEQALARVHDALALAHELSHPFSLVFARCWAAFVAQLRRDVPTVHEYAEAAVALSTEQGFPLWAARERAAWVGAGYAGPGRGGHDTAPSGDRRLAGNRGSTGRPIFLHHTGARLVTTWATRKTASRRWLKPIP